MTFLNFIDAFRHMLYFINYFKMLIYGNKLFFLIEIIYYKVLIMVNSH